MYLKKYHIHFVGIGGIGMSGIAELLLNLGYKVSGSDMKASEITDNLIQLGGTIYIGHRKEQVGDADVAVVAYGFTARAAIRAVRQLRADGIRAGLLRLRYLWPFPDDVITGDDLLQRVGPPR